MQLGEALDRLELGTIPESVEDLNSKFQSSTEHINVLLQSAPTPTILKKYRSNLELLYSAHEIVYTELTSGLDQKEAKNILGVLGDEPEHVVRDVYYDLKKAYNEGLNDSDSDLAHQCKLELLRLDKAYEVLTEGMKAETSRLAAIEQAKKEEEIARKAEETRLAKIKAEEEASRLAIEQKVREEEEKRLAAEAEAARKVEEKQRAEEKRLALEAEEKARKERERLASEEKEKIAAAALAMQDNLASETAEDESGENENTPVVKTAESASAKKKKRKKAFPLFSLILIGILISGIVGASWLLFELNKDRILGSSQPVIATENAYEQDNSDSFSDVDSITTDEDIFIVPVPSKDESEKGYEDENEEDETITVVQESQPFDSTEPEDQLEENTVDNSPVSPLESETMTEDQTENVAQVEKEVEEALKSKAKKSTVSSKPKSQSSESWPKPKGKKTSALKNPIEKPKPQTPSEPDSYKAFTYTPGRRVFLEEFEGRETRFNTRPSEGKFKDIINGAYETRMFDKKESGFTYTTTQIRIDEKRDFAISATVLYLKGDVENEMGLVWARSRSSFLMFGINHRGKFSVRQYENGELHKEHIVNQACRLIKKGFINSLIVAKVGSKWVFSINGKEVHSIKYLGMYGYDAGFVIPNDANIRYDNFKIEYIK